MYSLAKKKDGEDSKTHLSGDIVFRTFQLLSDTIFCFTVVENGVEGQNVLNKKSPALQDTFYGFQIFLKMKS